MRRLREIIGPSPSELSLEELIPLTERRRRKTLEIINLLKQSNIKTPKIKKEKPSTQKQQTNELLQLAEQNGLTLDELMKLIERA